MALAFLVVMANIRNIDICAKTTGGYYNRTTSVAATAENVGGNFFGLAVEWIRIGYG